jgi:hypothetical protein
VELKAQLQALRELDPDTLSEAELRESFLRLLAFAEACLAVIQELRTENQALKDEVARLKGEQGKPSIRPRGGGKSPSDAGSDLTHPTRDHSSEAERRPHEERQPWKKRPKLPRLVVDRTETLTHFPTPLPPDARFKGYEAVVLQDLVLKTDTVRFLRAKFYSPATGKSYLAPLPPGYAGQFGPGLKTLALSLVYGCHLSQPLLHAFLEDAGILISRGQVSALVTPGGEAGERFHPEQAEVLRAGLASAPWQHLDVTSTRVDGENFACHVLGNPLYAHYHTTPRQDRGSALDVLRGGAPRTYRLDATAFALLQEYRLPVGVCRVLARFPQETTWTQAEFFRLLDLRLPLLGVEARKQVEDAAAIAAYWADPHWPVVRCLIVDDAAQFRGLTRELALCWVHDGRHYKKLLPQFACFRQAVARFRKRYWEYYQELLAYRKAPSEAEAKRLEAAFDTLFATETGYVDLNVCIRRTQANQAKLLRVLAHPELPLHNNPAELMARRRVRKRDVSFGPRSPTGLRAWDTFQGLAETTRKLGVRFSAYLWDRITQAGELAPLAEIITARAETLRLGASWAA